MASLGFEVRVGPEATISKQSEVSTNEYGELARELIRRNIGEVRYEEICQQFGLDSTDKDLLSKLISRWKPDFTVEDIMVLSEEFKDRSNIGKVMQALALISRESAEISEFRRRGENN